MRGFDLGDRKALRVARRLEEGPVAGAGVDARSSASRRASGGVVTASATRGFKRSARYSRPLKSAGR